MIQAPVKTVGKTRFIPRITSRRLNKALKLGLDYALTIPTLLLIGPLMILIALLIKLDSPGPVIYRRRAVGLNGREFYAYKFRTMYVDGNLRLMQNREQWLTILREGTVQDDPRLTRVGRFLHRYGLEELPRLFNVLERSMSLVGPRMISRAEMMKFGHRIEGYTSVLPGLTGMWQVRGHSPDVEDRIRLESEYIRDWSVLLDLQILLQSVVVAFTTQA